MTPEEAQVLAEYQAGTIILLTHVFNCLHHRGVLPRSEAISSLEQTEQGLPPQAGLATRAIIRNVVSGLRLQPEPQTPTPDQPPPPTRPDLQVIQGGRSE